MALQHKRDTVQTPECQGESPVFLQMRDVVTSEVFREERRMERRRPRAFWMQGLRAARRYVIEFEGINNSADRNGDSS